MKNIEAALEEAGAGMGDVVRVRYILPDRRDFEKTWWVFFFSFLLCLSTGGLFSSCPVGLGCWFWSLAGGWGVLLSGRESVSGGLFC